MTITEVGKRYNLTPDTLRYYERIGILPTVNRSKNGVRNYTEDDCGWIEFAKYMREAGLPIETLIEYVSLFQKGNETIEVRKEILHEQRDLVSNKIEELIKTREKLDHKLSLYEEKILLIKKNKEK